MEELLKIVQTSEEYCNELRQLKEQFIQDLRAKLGGQKPTKADSTSSDILPTATPQQIKKRIKRLSDLNESDGDSLPENKSLGRSARSSNSRPLAAAVTMDAENFDDYIVSQTKNVVPMPAPRSTKTQETEQTEEQLMPPPPVPIAPLQADVTQSIETSFARPQRAAKLKSEKNLKEPKLNNKLRRPSKSDTTTVKLEHEQRPSQFYQVIENVSETNRDSSKSTASVRSEDSVVAILAKAPSVVEINSEDEETTNDKESPRNSVDDGKKRGLRIKIKREKSSLGSTNKKSGDTSQLSSASKASVNPEQTVPIPKVAIKSESDDSTLTSTVSINTTSTSTNTKRRKKKDAVPKPIKVERFSDIEKPARTRKEHQKQVRTSGGSVYEDAVDHPIVNESTDTPPTRVSTVPPQVAAAAGVNETVNNRTQPDKTANLTVVTGGAPSDATFCANAAQTTFQVDAGQATFVMDTQNANMTVTMDKKSGGTGASVADTTYNVHGNGPDNSTASSQHSMETAKDTTHPQHDSLITEDESFEPEKPKSKLATLPKPGPAATKLGPSKVYKMPTRTNELFNPLVQSPVKKKVEAFENAAIAAHSTEVTSTGRPKRTKENTAPSSLTTPTIGKLASAPALGRFLTPTQSSNLTGTLTKVKKVPNSASKAMAHPKAMTSVKGAGSATSSKPLSRENSAEDFRKGLHNLAEERKKQREQKHLIAAQQREAKERERAERAAKLVKEREEKRLKRQQEAEQKKQALEEIQRNLRQQEEAAKLKAAKLKAEQEREVLQQVKQQNARAAAGKMLPPPPKLQSKYTFDMLHEDDSTDEEEKTSYKRPPPPTWSRSHVRGAAIRMQQYWPTKIIDSFFSVQPMSPDLRSIFPNISAHHLKRNSSVLWTTPPRYSELPKY
ncbi:mucin-5AC [Anastrepha ludens]|uniref:mucin-5AC n=1 Tax=Anastrepha ludens TaxID=28586 RepID=UPI0023AF410E|nr:mucin-5AC [Anastrepha ludens]